ncbi:MAG: cyclic nucleotide-binding domain-containing protein [Thermoanaerobaculia bacterium]
MKFVKGSEREEKNFLSFKKGEVIFREGDLGTEMFVIQKGKVEVRKKIGAEEQVLSVLEKGDFFGEMAILEGMPRSATAIALEDTDCIVINEATFDNMIKENVEIAIRMLRKLSKNLRRTTELLDQIAGKTFTIPRSEVVKEENKQSPFVLKSLDWPDIKFYVKEEGLTLVGRKDPVTEIYPDIDLSNLDPQKSVSRRHAKLFIENDKLFIQEEIGTHNGTFINGKKLEKGIKYEVNPEDRVQFGLVVLIFEKE